MDNLTGQDMLRVVARYAQMITDQAQRIAIAKGYDVDFIKAYSPASYQRGVEDAARLYWKEGSRGNFLTRMNTLIKFGLNDAWNAGAAICGVLPSEFQPEDAVQITSLIVEEQSHVENLFDYLFGLANDPKASLADASSRLAMWGNRWNDIYNQALVWFGGKTKLKWVYGPTEHCETCRGLNGIVAWASEWEQAGIAPQSSLLACHGYRCKCQLVPTDQRRSGRALTRIMDIVTGSQL